MRKRAREDAARAETAETIAALKMEGARLWRIRESRTAQSLLYIIFGFILFIASIFLGPVLMEMLPAASLPSARALEWIFEFGFPAVALIACIFGLGLFIDGMRLGFKVENIDTEIRTLNPEARLLTSWPEEIGRGIRARLDERRDS